MTRRSNKVKWIWDRCKQILEPCETGIIPVDKLAILLTNNNCDCTNQDVKKSLVHFAWSNLDNTGFGKYPVALIGYRVRDIYRGTTKYYTLQDTFTWEDESNREYVQEFTEKNNVLKEAISVGLVKSRQNAHLNKSELIAMLKEYGQRNPDKFSDIYNLCRDERRLLFGLNQLIGRSIDIFCTNVCRNYVQFYVSGYKINTKFMDKSANMQSVLELTAKHNSSLEKLPVIEEYEEESCDKEEQHMETKNVGTSITTKGAAKKPTVFEFMKNKVKHTDSYIYKYITEFVTWLNAYLVDTGKNEIASSTKDIEKAFIKFIKVSGRNTLRQIYMPSLATHLNTMVKIQDQVSNIPLEIIYFECRENLPVIMRYKIDFDKIMALKDITTCELKPRSRKTNKKRICDSLLQILKPSFSNTSRRNAAKYFILFMKWLRPMIFDIADRNARISMNDISILAKKYANDHNIVTLTKHGTPKVLNGMIKKMQLIDSPANEIPGIIQYFDTVDGTGLVGFKLSNELKKCCMVIRNKQKYQK